MQPLAGCACASRQLVNQPAMGSFRKVLGDGDAGTEHCWWIIQSGDKHLVDADMLHWVKEHWNQV